MVLASVAAIATASGAVWGLDKTDTGLTDIEARTQDMADDLTTVCWVLPLGLFIYLFCFFL